MGQPEETDQGRPLGPGELNRLEPGELIGLYQLAVEMADRVSARRGAANAFFSGLHAALASVLGVFGPWFASGAQVDPAVIKIGSTGVAVVGLLLSAVWYILLRSYRDLNEAKFKVITNMEQGLPRQLFCEEWAILKKDPVKRWRKRYAEFGDVERIVPVVFAALYLFFAVFVWAAWR